MNDRGSVMIMVGVFALALLVLMPRVGVISNEAKEAGEKANVLALEGIVRSVIDDYEANNDGVYKLEESIKTSINSADEGSEIINPITGKADCIEKSRLSKGGAILYIKRKDNNMNNEQFWPDVLSGAEGMIGYAAYVDENTNKLSVRIVPYDVAGNKIIQLEKVISQ